MAVHVNGKQLTDEQWDAYYAKWLEEIIPESDVLPRTGTMGFWTQGLVKTYLRPYSLGPAPNPRYGGRAKNTYKNKHVIEAQASIPFAVALRRWYQLGNVEGSIMACIGDEERRIKALAAEEQAAAEAAMQAVIDKLEQSVADYCARRDAAQAVTA